MRRIVLSLVLVAVVAGLWLGAANPVQADDQTTRFYHYPYYYFPHNYWPNAVKYPDPRVPYQLPPAYMAYPPFLDTEFRYEYWQNHRYHRGFHFWLDQF
jgi:hypothetical protein